MNMTTLAHTPFIDPLPAHGLWFVLLIPVAIGISITWKAIRTPDLPPAPPTNQAQFPLRAVLLQSAFMTAQIVLGMIALGALSYLAVQYVVPALVPK
jgi:hypothetical protein